MNERATDQRCSVETPTTAGGLILALVGELSARGVPWVYLRNYEGLPEEVGNDVDLLVSGGQRDPVAAIFREVAEGMGWQELSRTRFGPLAQYIWHPESGATLHIDLFDRVEWHQVEIADASAVLARRRWNGTVHVPDEGDEVYLNVLTRLIYNGTVREKHRQQASSGVVGAVLLRERFVSHLGNHGGRLFDQLLENDWSATAESRGLARRGAWREYGLKRPRSLAVGIGRYVS
ncbi:MAG: hypothetical protein O3A92_11760, partial [Verrucomicrobia bacterium]|nr:hypothetical protein [Verrucomicrobiota bacterium]